MRKQSIGESRESQTFLSAKQRDCLPLQSAGEVRESQTLVKA